jgi:hypothetical protein
MTRRCSLLLFCALAPIGVVAGCGSSASTSATTHATSAASPTTTQATPLAVKIRLAIAACRKQVTKSPYIPAAEKPVAQADCNGIKSGNITSLKVILRQACLNAVAKLPAADQGPAALACKKLY